MHFDKKFRRGRQWEEKEIFGGEGEERESECFVTLVTYI